MSSKGDGGIKIQSLVSLLISMSFWATIGCFGWAWSYRASFCSYTGLTLIPRKTKSKTKKNDDKTRTTYTESSSMNGLQQKHTASDEEHGLHVVNNEFC